MTEPRKAALSLLTTILLFAVFTVASFAGLFDLIEARFYNPAVVTALSGELSHETVSVEVFITTIKRWFSDSLAESAVKRSFMVNQTNADIYERSQIFARLHEKVDGLQWVRFIDAGGNRIHYSTWQGDLVREDSAMAVYRMYPESMFYTPLESILPLQAEDSRIVFDTQGQRILFSLPFYDALDAYRGLAVFSLSVSAIQNRLLAGRNTIQGKLWLIAEPPGLLRGVPEDGMDGIFETVAENWNRSGIAKKVSVSAIESGGNRTRLVLLSSKTAQGIYIGNLINENVFVFPLSLKILLLILFFVSMFLVLFLIVNIRQDPMTIVQSRLKKLQVELIKEYYEQKTDIELGRWGMNLMQRREEIRAELKHGLKTNIGKKQDDNINAYIDKSWNDLLAVIGGRLERTVNEEEIQLSLSRLTDTLSSLVEGGMFMQTEKADRPTEDQNDQKKTGTETSPGKAETPVETEVIEEMLPFAEEAEEFPVTDEPPKSAFDESEEMIPFMEDIEEPHEEISIFKHDPDEIEETAVFTETAPDENAGSGQDENKEKAIFPENADEFQFFAIPESDSDETEGMAPFGFDAPNSQTEKTVSEPAGTFENIDDINDIEVLDDAEIVEELPGAEEVEKLPDAEEPDTPSSGIDGIARAVEWSEATDEMEEPFALEIEVSAPYSSLADAENTDFVEKNVFDDDNENVAALEDADTPDATPFLYTPFTPVTPQTASGYESKGPAGKADFVNTAYPPSAEDEQIIREQNGIAYIQESALRPTADEEEDLDPRMKGLVNSVLKQI